ncbi:MAG: GNAT family N-acetyltransferase [Proteocatella sp.]
MKFQVITIEESYKWDRIVKSFNNYDVYYLSGYIKSFQLHGDGEPLLLYFENKNTKAMNVVMKRDIAKYKHFVGKLEEKLYFDLSTPYGYGGFVIEGDDFQGLNKAYTNYCTDNNIVSEFVRFHPLLENWKKLNSLYEIIHLGETVCLDTTSQEVIWSNISSKNRNMIRKAKKSGLKTYWCRDEKIIDSFIEIYNDTMDKDFADSYYYFNKDFYLSILNDLKYHAIWFYTELDGEIAAISIFMFCNGNMHYHLSASRKEYQKMAPTNLLLYEASSWACENGYTRMHLGGGLGSEHDNLYKFKKAFNKEKDTEFHIGKKIFENELYQKLVDVRMQDDNYDEKTSFFPSYRD